jgi:hypothetical protein
MSRRHQAHEDIGNRAAPIAASWLCSRPFGAQDVSGRRAASDHPSSRRNTMGDKGPGSKSKGKKQKKPKKPAFS